MNPLAKRKLKSVITPTEGIGNKFTSYGLTFSGSPVSVSTNPFTWEMSAQDKENFTEIFKKVDTNNDGFISQEEAFSYLVQMGIEKDYHSKIWYFDYFIYSYITQDPLRSKQRRPARF
jgi:hypothetical protein